MTTSLYARRLKRPLDLAASGLAVAALAPLFIAIGATIKLSSRGPVLFSQKRAGKDGVPFEVLKFRSMLDPDQSTKPDGTEMSNTERVTAVGRILRRTSLDELPQLLNVIRGDMSVIGPRPA